jgi:transposase-like protein
MIMTKPNSSAASAAGSQPRSKRRRKKLAPSQKYEVFTAVLTSSATQRELAEQYGVDRTTIRSICATAKQGALEAWAAVVPGRHGKSAEEIELEEARAESALSTALPTRWIEV